MWNRKPIIRGTRQFVENHFVDMIVGRIQLLVDATVCPVRRLVDKNSQVRPSGEIVNSIILWKSTPSPPKIKIEIFNLADVQLTKP